MLIYFFHPFPTSIFDGIHDFKGWGIWQENIDFYDQAFFQDTTIAHHNLLKWLFSLQIDRFWRIDASSHDDFNMRRIFMKGCFEKMALHFFFRPLFHGMR